MFETKIDHDLNLTIHTGKGIITLDEYNHVLENYYQSEFTEHVIWDHSASDISRIKPEDLFKVLEIGKKYINFRKHGLTIIVVPTSASYGLARMLQTYAEMTGFDRSLPLCKTLDAAINIIKSPVLV